YVMGHFRWDRF
nr:Chain L, gamma-melanocyte-stimulating hormone [synthetic construct]